MAFRTRVTSLSLTLDPHTTFYKGEALISWSLDLDVREWGVKDATPTVTDFQVNVLDEFYDEVADEDKAIPRTFTKADFEGYELETRFGQNEGDLAQSLTITPRELSIDYRQKRIIVEF